VLVFIRCSVDNLRRRPFDLLGRASAELRDKVPGEFRDTVAVSRAAAGFVPPTMPVAGS